MPQSREWLRVKRADEGRGRDAACFDAVTSAALVSTRLCRRHWVTVFDLYTSDFHEPCLARIIILEKVADKHQNEAISPNEGAYYGRLSSPELLVLSAPESSSQSCYRRFPGGVLHTMSYESARNIYVKMSDCLCKRWRLR